MLNTFKTYLISTCKCSPEKQFLLAVSGGIDSVVMAHLFNAGGFHFAIAHCNFQLRGDESTADQQFVEDLSSAMHVRCHVNAFDTVNYASKMGISVQMAARDLRYSWFEELAGNFGYTYIAVGHNKNDIVETILLNLSRGTGIRGLMGIRPLHGKIIRPLLFSSRKQIAKYANDHELAWREDSSNAQTKYLRNKIRHTIIPAFETCNPAFMQNVLNTAKRIEQTGKLLNYTLLQIKQSICTELPDRMLLNIEKLKAYPANDIVLFELLREYGVTHLSEDMLLNTIQTDVGKQFHTDSHTFTRDREVLIVTPRNMAEHDEKIIEAGTLLLDYPVRLFFSSQDNSRGFSIPRNKNIAALDADKVKFPLLLRGWRAGDRFNPLGLQGTKKVSDFLINIKLPVPDKKNVWVIETGGEIVWIVNHRIDDRFKVTKETTKILLIEYKE